MPQAKKPRVFLLTSSRFERPKTWKWNHERMNIIILELEAAEYAGYRLRSRDFFLPTPPIFHPLRPSPMVKCIYWGKIGMLALARIRRDGRFWPTTHPETRRALAQARRICWGLEQAGHIVEWGGFKPQKPTPKEVAP